MRVLKREHMPLMEAIFVDGDVYPFRPPSPTEEPQRPDRAGRSPHTGGPRTPNHDAIAIVALCITAAATAAIAGR
jgi:hypothetical protein